MLPHIRFDYSLIDFNYFYISHFLVIKHVFQIKLYVSFVRLHTATVQYSSATPNVSFCFT